MHDAGVRAAMPTPEELLACALTYRSAPVRADELPSKFENGQEAVKTFLSVLLHEAHEAMASPLDTPPASRYLHPVDVETDEPGIVDGKDTDHVARYRPDKLPRVQYGRRSASRPSAGDDTGQVPPRVNETDVAAAQERTKKEFEKALVSAQKKAATAQRRETRQREAKEARQRETEEEREARLQIARAKREETKQKRAAAKEEGTPTRKPTKQRKVLSTPPPSEESMTNEDVSVANVMKVEPLTKRKRGTLTFYTHPLPHHRHMMGLQMCRPSEKLLPALLHGIASDAVQCIQGPPGTGKTRHLVERVTEQRGRILLCAPTNVGVINLYARCIADETLRDEVSLVMAQDRIPPGTVVLSNDPARRVVCATISARSGGFLSEQRFESVFVDEAAQCMEAWVWTLLRGEVTRLVMAGDVKQLTALVSDSGRRLAHQRSLMERLVVDLAYENVTRLTVQHRMAPELLLFPNVEFYGGSLQQGEHAPTHGAVEVHIVPDGTEEAIRSSYRNEAESERVAALVSECDEDEEVVLVTPYTAQCHSLLARGTKRTVHTVDSFQGHEADTIVLSIVRDGSEGMGFWNDPRRLAVALTRARRRLVLVASRPDRWPSEFPLTRLLASFPPVCAR